MMTTQSKTGLGYGQEIDLNIEISLKYFHVLEIVYNLLGCLDRFSITNKIKFRVVLINIYLSLITILLHASNT